MVKEPVKQTKLLSKKSDGKRESEGNKALRIPQKLVSFSTRPFYPRLIPFLTKFSSPPGLKKKKTTTTTTTKKRNESWSS